MDVGPRDNDIRSRDSVLRVRIDGNKGIERVAAAKAAGITLPDNACRHTFISMHVAFYESTDKTALEPNASVDIIKRNYLDIVAKAEAEGYWNIGPTAQLVNAVPIAAVA